MSILYRLSRIALTATGFIWVRYSLVITPINYSLAAVRFSSSLRGCTSLTVRAGQLLRWVDRSRPAEPHLVVRAFSF